MSVAYLANSFPEAVESYVWEEIRELRRRRVKVVPCAMRRSKVPPAACANWTAETLYALPLRAIPFIRANWALATSLWKLRDLIWRAVRGPETVTRRFRTLVHTWLGAYLATLLVRKDVTHIHVHHGYFSAWVGMVAARILDASFSMTLHGSDLLVRADYLDIKLAQCSFCFTISEFNRRHILRRYPLTDPPKVLVQHLGIDATFWRDPVSGPGNPIFSILSVGRLHAVKNHGFLILACHALKNSGILFRCAIAGEGEEHGSVQALIDELGLADEVILLGNVPREQLPSLYASADAVTLTSHSEGVPVALMEAMAMERIVIAPRLSGIPELVVDGENGFLYTPESMEDFLTKLQLVIRCGSAMQPVRRAARKHVLLNFNAQINFANFVARFVERVADCHQPTAPISVTSHENPLLQQI
jgi:colanic acid/amylovoran biosynthesis glycosyltransferase